MDWTRCIVCQQKTAEVLKCPMKTVRADDKSETYVSFLNNVNEFRDLNQLPVIIVIKIVVVNAVYTIQH